MKSTNAASLYERYTRAIADVPLPCAIVDLDALEQNARALNSIAKRAHKSLRLATKSVRVPKLIRTLVESGEGVVRGLMTYTVTESAFLADDGFDDLLVAYPSAQKSDADILAELTARGKTVSIVCDDEAQLDVIERAAAAKNVMVRICVELDVSYRPGGLVHLGGRRSPLHDASSVVAFADQVRRRPHLLVDGVMAYEGHIAGVTDKNPFAPAMNAPKRALKLLSKPDVARRRKDTLVALKSAGHEVRVMNGGGTGSLQWASAEDALTEVTAGSGYLDSHLFSYYRDLDLVPAAFFALQAVRKPKAGMITCHGGGYVASGEAGPDRLPLPALPEGAKLLPLEGAGEVQTPVVLPDGVDVAIGAPVFFRHAKAGELAEHFNEYLLVRGDKIVDRAPTYRGLGKCFLG